MEPRLAARRAAFDRLTPLPPRAELLARDLTVLGIDPTATPRCEALPALASDAEAVGAIYVIEGSALGGAVLARLARRELAVGPATGAAFLSGDADLSARWRLVVETISETGDAHGVDGLIAGACETFDAMEAWLCR